MTSRKRATVKTTRKLPSPSFAVAQAHLAKVDPILKSIIKQWGPCTLVPRHDKPLETLVGSIISQQLSTKAAATIKQRFLDLYKPARFPTPEKIVETPDTVLRACGLSSQKLGYIKDLAQKVLDREVKLVGIEKLSDEDIIAELTKVKGIGVWTVHMFLIFSLGRPNVLPFGDLGIKSAILKQYQRKQMPTPAEISELAQERGWHPYCSIASWYLWRSLDKQA